MLRKKTSLPFSHMLLLFLYHLRNWHQVLSASYRIRFDTTFSPPVVIPKNPADLVYSVPLNQAINRMIIVHVMDQTGSIVTPDGNPDVTVSSIDASQSKGLGSDPWKTSGGQLCQRTSFGKTWPARLNRQKYTKTCGSKLDSTVLVKKFVNNMIILDWLSHEHPNGNVPPNGRFLRVGIPSLKLTADSNVFNITVPAGKLVISKQPPKSVTGNTGFDVSAEIRDVKNAIITEGLDSVLYVELTVPYEYKQFYHTFGKDMLIYSTDIRLAGSDVVTHQGTNDLVIRKQASGGRVDFKGVRILDVTPELKLNLTMYMPRDPWLRAPNCVTCYADIYEKDVDMYGLVKFRPMTKSLLGKTPAVILTETFEVVQQTLDKLIIVSPFKNRPYIEITRNFPIPGPMYLEAGDKYGNRIYSGMHANLPIEMETSPKGICISDDRIKYIRGGYGKLFGSICQLSRMVHLVLYSKMKPSLVVNSTKFNVVGNIHILHFEHLRYSGAGWHIEPHVNSFIRFGAEDINTGAIPGVLKHFQMKLLVDTVETHNSIRLTINNYAELRTRSEDSPSETARMVIMPKDKETAAALIRDVNNDEITMIALSQKKMEYSEEYFFSRLCWNWDQITQFFFVACKERGWTQLSMLTMDHEEIPDSFFSFSAILNLTLNEEVRVPIFDPLKWKEGMLSAKFDELRGYNTLIIICLVKPIYQSIVLSEAYRSGMSSLDGYQWLFLSDYAWGFPTQSTCGLNIKCTEAFKGSLLFTETYNNSHFDNSNWHRALHSFLSGDRTSIQGIEPSYPTSDVGSFMGLGYDAVWLFAEALNRIISRQHTATGLRIVRELRKINIEGLTGALKLTGSGERIGFLGTIKVVNPDVEGGIQLIRYTRSAGQDNQIEFKYGTARKSFDPDNKLFYTMIPLPKADVYNVREFVSYTGGISARNNMLVEDRSEAWPSVRIRRFEKVAPQFTCKRSCGKRVNINDVNLYDRGTCISKDTCACFFGYYGDSCEEISCTCLFGRCLVPFKCTCSPGWEGKQCNEPICAHECQNGKCVEPEVCKCHSSVWVGENCADHIAAIITPVVLILAILAYLVYRGISLMKKYLERRAALSDLSWVVKWNDVILVDSNTTSKMSCMFEELYTWNQEKWYPKNFNSKTIDTDDSRVRVDMVELMSISHKNIITYGGACLTYPNVCLLVEPAHKGSLEDVLVNESIQLGWDFRFSFLKDITTGMNYLHTKTGIGSHGRLKSSNCLLDKRWTVRISGFGAPTIRYGPYSMLQSNAEDPLVYHENQTSLLWTAPELLESASCLDDVRMGTLEGDSYSYGIITAEIVTRDIPYAQERNVLPLFSILDLIVDRDNPSLDSERDLWNSMGGDVLCIRPQVTSEQLPEGKAVKKKFKKMLDDVWCEEPQLRLSFQKLVPLLDKIYPSKGELMDNLINLLESYSANLEQVVVERTADLEVEKTKIDMIISQMLPRQVVESLKNGEKVQPEVFDNVTVFYSDIVGFTTIAKKSKPMQVVDLLNTLYGKFDTILAQHDVYKVETIGDAYVVSSGVPERNGNLHAGEIATASIDIVCTIMTVPIPHLPDDKLLLRIGIHSGSVVAGVVGLKMPRYTLFGETMQICANLEASSKPLHIQVSHYTINILKMIGGFVFKPRGEKEVCGKTIKTFWLVRKEGYEKVLPDVIDD